MMIQGTGSALGKASLELRTNQQARIYFAASVVFVIIGAFLTRHSEATPSIKWMSIYRVEDIDSVAEALEFYANLRVPIPVPVSLLEIISHNLSLNTFFVSRFVYRLSIILAYLLAFAVCYPSLYRLALVFPISVLFLWSTAIIHPGNPQLYDVIFPCLMLLSLVFLKIAEPSRSKVSGSVFAAFAAGFFLSLAELTRPFVIFLIPIVIVTAYVRFGGLSRRHFLIFMAPIVVLSGTWHVYQLTRHGQLTWSNHSGFNLSRAWPMVESPELVREDSPPIEPGRWPNLNTWEHAENSRLWQTAIVRYVISNPMYSADHMLRKVTDFASAPTGIWAHQPDHPVLDLYRPAVLVSMTFAGVGSGLLVLSLIGYRGKVTKLLGAPENALIFLTFLIVLILSVSETGEEARLLVSILPFLVLLQPAVHALAQPRRNPRSVLIPYAIILLGIALVVLGATIDIIRTGSIDFGTRQFVAMIGGAYVFAVGILELRRGTQVAALQVVE
ncbi:MAG: hypothetical protein ACE5M4_05260 [Anaerolineales bacterium]